jgi:L-serine dehydratase
MAAPSIFNEVIGPVMRGPSSSHCAAALRIGRLARDLMDGQIDAVLVEYDPSGSLATTHASQGSDLGLLAGVLGYEATDDLEQLSSEAAGESGLPVQHRVTDLGRIGKAHPNTYKLTLTSAAEQHTMVAISTGGGMIEVVEIDGCAVSMRGDCYETLIFLEGDPSPVAEHLAAQPISGSLLVHHGADRQLIEVKDLHFLDRALVEYLDTHYEIRGIRRLSPVLPVLKRPDVRLPFLTCAEMLAYNETRELSLPELALRYESARSGLSSAQVLDKMRDIVRILYASVHEGVRGTAYEDRILGPQAKGFLQQMASHDLLDAGILNRTILYVTALMEVKSAMGVIVAAPTAGACGALPGACLATVDCLGLTGREAITAAAEAMLAAGLIGVFIAGRATFAAEVGGCQAECGAGSGMAAAALVTLAGGSAKEAVAAAAMALQNVLGLVCDPVANRVEVPCLGRNVMAASNALACANMALAGYDPVIPLDEVLAAMDEVGRSLPATLRCTALGGLSVTPTSLEIAEKLDSLKH